MRQNHTHHTIPSHVLCEKKVEDPTVGKSIHNKAVQFTNFLSTIYFKVECNFNTSTKMQMQMRFMLIARNFTQIEMKCTANESTAAYWQMCVLALYIVCSSVNKVLVNAQNIETGI